MIGSSPYMKSRTLVAADAGTVNLQIALFGISVIKRSSVDSWSISAMSPAANSSWETGTPRGGFPFSRRRLATKA
eukprot:4135126-Pleurochrysis_carterae.AAC.1